jgi:hypothetical protein
MKETEVEVEIQRWLLEGEGEERIQGGEVVRVLVRDGGSGI